MAEDAAEGVWVAEAADAGHGAEVVVESAVLLHEEDHVLDLLERGGGGELRSASKYGINICSFCYDHMRK